MQAQEAPSVDQIPLVESADGKPMQLNSIYLKVTPRHPFKNRRNGNVYWHVGLVPMNVLLAFSTGTYQVKKGVENGSAVFYIELRPDVY